MSGRRLFWIVTPFLAVALVLQVARAERLWRVSRTVSAVEQVTAELSLAGRAPRGRIEYHLQLLRQSDRLVPGWVDVPVARGWQYLLTDRPEAAVRSFEEALELEPRAEIYANLVQAYLMTGDREAALEAYKAVRLLDPSLEIAVGGELAAALRADRNGEEKR